MPFPAVPLLMKPVFSPRPWGGDRLAASLGKNVPSGEKIGESWELSDHPNGRSTIASGPMRGQLFGDVVREHSREMISRHNAPERFPLLVKFIDAAEDLSIQVHPDDATAPPGDRGKTECWYVMDCGEGAEVILGLERGIGPEDLRRGAADGSIERMVRRHPLAPGDFLFVPAGTVHAILGGTLICEIQQSSDTTYRLWDWNRQPSRELHIEQSLRVIDWQPPTSGPRRVPLVGELRQPMILTENPYFEVMAFDVAAGDRQGLPRGSESCGRIVVCVAGEGRLCTPAGEIPLARGATAFVPACCGANVTLFCRQRAPLRVLLAESREP